MEKSRLFLKRIFIASLLVCVCNICFGSEFPNKIISLYPAHTENLFYLGLNKEIIGVSRSETYPAAALKKKVFTPFDDVERFISVKPDLIIIRPMLERAHFQLFSKLHSLGIKVVSLQPRTVSEMYEYWLELGRLTGRERQALNMVNRFKTELRKIQSIVACIPLSKRKRVFFESIHRKFKTFSPSSIAIFVLNSAGGINVAEDAIPVRGTNIASYGKERILSHADEIDVYISQKGYMNHITKEEIINEPGFKAIKAIRDEQVYIIPEELVSRPTMRLIKGIYLIGHILYPKYFNRTIR